MAVIQFKRGVLANLPGLQAGEPGFTTDSYDLYVGLTSSTATNKIIGSNRFWTNSTATTGSGVNLVEGTNNGTSYITLKAPDSLAGITTYTFPATPTADYFLKTSADGTLSWNAVTLNSFAGIVTFTGTTDNTLGNANTGTVQIDGGVGIEKNLTVGGNLNVQGYSELVGVVTFKGGTINLGDSTGDDINVGGEFISGLFPNTTAIYNLGDSARQWQHGSFSGIVTASSFDGNLALADITGLAANVSTFLATPSSANLASAITDETGTGALVFANTPTLVTPVLGAASATSIEVSGSVNVGSALSAPTVKTATIQHSNGTNAATIDTSGNITASQNLTVSGNLFVNGSTTQVNTTTTTIEDQLLDLGMVDGAAPSSDLNKDIGILLNYYTSSAKKAAIFWDDSASRIVFADDVTESTGVLTVAANAHASIEIEGLWVNDCAGQSQVISCAGGVRTLDNITIDGGSF